MGLIPVIPVLDNVWASKQAEELVLKARESRQTDGMNTPLHAAYVLSMVRRGNVFDMCQETLETKAQIPILKSKVSMRNAFPESQIYGCVAKSFGKNTAGTEIDNLAKEILGIIGLKILKGDKK
jgi:chromosome partitioning protein